MLTRSRAASPVSAGASSQDPRPLSQAPAPETVPRGADADAALAGDGIAGASVAGVPSAMQAAALAAGRCWVSSCSGRDDD